MFDYQSVNQLYMGSISGIRHIYIYYHYILYIYILYILCIWELMGFDGYIDGIPEMVSSNVAIYGEIVELNGESSGQHV